MGMGDAAALGLTTADCERIGDGLFGQPVNTASSVAFLIAALWILERARRSSARRVELAVFGLAVAGNAVGGFLFHGVRTAGSTWVHDEAIVAVLLFAGVSALARFGAWPRARTVATFAAALAGVGVLLALAPATSYAIFAVLGLGAAAFEVGEYRRVLPTIRAEGWSSQRLARFGVAAVAALGATAFFVGRTGAALCRPDSAFQWHAVWHALAAVAMALYAYGSIEPHPADQPGGRSPRSPRFGSQASATGSPPNLMKPASRTSSEKQW